MRVWRHLRQGTFFVISRSWCQIKLSAVWQVIQQRRQFEDPLPHSQRQEKTQNMPKQLSCDVCPKTFARRSHLLRHERAHGGGVKYNCTLCNKSFSQNTSLKANSREKPHKCTHCDYSCSDPSSLKTQLKKHIEEKITIAINVNLRQHIQAAWGCIRGSTQGKNCTTAINVNTKHPNLVLTY